MIGRGLKGMRNIGVEVLDEEEEDVVCFQSVKQIFKIHMKCSL